MSTAIENLLFRSYGTHGVKSITIRENVLTLVVAPWTALDDELTANFSHARLRYIESEKEDLDGLELPWDIIAVDCVDIGGEKWKFCLRCSKIEIGFLAQWPKTATTT
ncbi:MAG TPA: hypothetical protein PK156_15080 [Polyangium sp.]|nr:hypothetical protein [Polyangium sp.]